MDKTKVRKPGYGSKVIDTDEERKEIPKFENRTMAKTLIKSPKSEKQTIAQEPKSENPKLGNRTVRKPNRINKNNSNNKNNLYKEKENNFHEKDQKAIGSSSIISKGNSQPYNLTSYRQNFMTINTKQKLENFKKNRALKPNAKGFG